MKTLIITLLTATFLASCQTEDDKIINTQSAEKVTADFEFTFRDSGHITLSDYQLIDFDTVVFQHLNYSVDVTYGASLKVWGYNLDGIGDSVAMIHMVIDGVIDTTTVSGALQNDASMYYTIE